VFLYCITAAAVSAAQTVGETTSRVVSLKYVSPAELLESLPLSRNESGGLFLKTSRDDVTVQINYANNKVLLTGLERDLDEAGRMIEFLDVPARQIVVEAKIVEVDNQKVLDAGLDWQRLLDRTSGNISYQEMANWRSPGTGNESGNNRVSIQSSISAGDLISLVEDTKVGRIVNVPRIVTLNNKKATLMDGQRLTYVAKYHSYGGVYETQEITSGLFLGVTPSIGSSGYLKLEVNAKLTTLGQVIDNTPTESGQILDNTVIVKDGGSVLLGGFKTEEKINSRHKVPLLGTILPFFFSRMVDEVRTREVLIVLTPRIVDLDQTPISDLGSE
jgi:type IV pilus assembly protein PilQ